MKHLAFITALCLLASLSWATFELDDPAKGYEKEMNIVRGDVEEQVVVPVGINLYAPTIMQGECNGWSLDESEPQPDDSSTLSSTTKTTHMGLILKSIDCKDAGETLRLALVKIEKSRLIWVELDRILANN